MLIVIVKEYSFDKHCLVNKAAAKVILDTRNGTGNMHDITESSRVRLRALTTTIRLAVQCMHFW